MPNYPLRKVIPGASSLQHQVSLPSMWRCRFCRFCLARRRSLHLSMTWCSRGPGRQATLGKSAAISLQRLDILAAKRSQPGALQEIRMDVADVTSTEPALIMENVMPNSMKRTVWIISEKEVSATNSFAQKRCKVQRRFNKDLISNQNLRVSWKAVNPRECV